MQTSSAPENFYDLILRRREAPSRRMAPGSGVCDHPSSRVLRTLLRMRFQGYGVA